MKKVACFLFSAIGGALANQELEHILREFAFLFGLLAGYSVFAYLAFSIYLIKDGKKFLHSIVPSISYDKSSWGYALVVYLIVWGIVLDAKTMGLSYLGGDWGSVLAVLLPIALATYFALGNAIIFWKEKTLLREQEDYERKMENLE